MNADSSEQSIMNRHKALLLGLGEPDSIAQSSSNTEAISEGIDTLDKKLLHPHNHSYNHHHQHQHDQQAHVAETLESLVLKTTMAARAEDEERKKRTSIGGSSYQRTESESSNELVETPTISGESPQLDMISNEFEFPKQKSPVDSPTDLSMIGKSNDETILILQQLIQKRSQLKEMDRQLFALISQCLAKLDSEETRLKLKNWLPLQCDQLPSSNHFLLPNDLTKTISPSSTAGAPAVEAMQGPDDPSQTSHHETPKDAIITTTTTNSKNQNVIGSEDDNLPSERRERVMDLSLTMPSGLTYNQLIGDDKLSTPSTANTPNPLNRWLHQLNPPSTAEPLERRSSTNLSIFNFRKSRLLDGVNLNMLNIERSPAQEETTTNDKIAINNDDNKQKLMPDPSQTTHSNLKRRKEDDKLEKIEQDSEDALTEPAGPKLEGLHTKRQKIEENLEASQVKLINNTLSINGDNSMDWLNYKQHHHGKRYRDDTSINFPQTQDQLQNRYLQTSQSAVATTSTSQSLNLNHYFVNYSHFQEQLKRQNLAQHNQSPRDYLLPFMSPQGPFNNTHNYPQLTPTTASPNINNHLFFSAQQYQLNLGRTSAAATTTNAISTAHGSTIDYYANNNYNRANSSTTATITAIGRANNFINDLMVKGTSEQRSLFASATNSGSHSDLAVALKTQEIYSNNNNNNNMTTIQNLAKNQGASSIDFELLARLGCDHQKLLAHQCHVCGSGFEDRHRLQQHLSIHLNLHPSWFEERTIKETMDQYESKRGDYLCKNCCIRFETTAEFDKHMQVHGEKPHKCDLCLRDSKSVSFRFYRQLLTHLRSHCFLYCCRFVPNCKQKANRKDYLKLHILKHHLNNKLPECYTICCH